MPIVVPIADMDALVKDSRVPCMHCGAAKSLLPHRIDQAKMRALRDLAILCLHNRWVRVEEGRGMKGDDDGKWEATAYCARHHIMRLSWWRLTLHREPRSALWRISQSGLLFLRGSIWVPKKILTQGGEVIYESKELVTVGDVREKFDKAYWDEYPWSDAYHKLQVTFAIGGRVRTNGQRPLFGL